MSNITEKIQEELKHARETCDVSGENSQECVAAWDALENLEAETATPTPDKTKNSLEIYCDDNPEAAECRLYDD